MDVPEDPTTMDADREIGLASRGKPSHRSHVTVDGDPLCPLAGDPDPIEEVSEAGYCRSCKKWARMLDIELPGEPEGSA
jgi:hypothetical protein